MAMALAPPSGATPTLGRGARLCCPATFSSPAANRVGFYVLDAKTMTLRQDSSPPDWALAGVNPDHVGEGFQAFYNHHFGTDPRTPRALDTAASAEAFGCNIHGNPVYWSGTSCIYHMAEKGPPQGISIRRRRTRCPLRNRFGPDNALGHFVRGKHRATQLRHARWRVFYIVERHPRRHRLGVLSTR